MSKINLSHYYIIGNWKLHGSRQRSDDLLSQIQDNLQVNDQLTVVICPPAVYLGEMAKHLQNVHLGAQNVSAELTGAFTGEVSAQMLQEMGCRYALIGHSERRQLFFEDNALIARKWLSAYHAGLIPVLCVGETAKQREQSETFSVLFAQLRAILDVASPELMAKTLVAYEPVWAIGTGLSATPSQVEEVHSKITSWLDDKGCGRVPILYGGSVKANNAASLLVEPSVSGLLVGGASLVPEDFLSICASAIETK